MTFDHKFGISTNFRFSIQSNGNNAMVVMHKWCS